MSLEPVVEIWRPAPNSSSTQAFLGILFGAFSLGQGSPYITDFITAKGAATTIWEIIDQVGVGIESLPYVSKITDQVVDWG